MSLHASEFSNPTRPLAPWGISFPGALVLGHPRGGDSEPECAQVVGPSRLSRVPQVGVGLGWVERDGLKGDRSGEPVGAGAAAGAGKARSMLTAVGSLLRLGLGCMVRGAPGASLAAPRLRASALQLCGLPRCYSGETRSDPDAQSHGEPVRGRQCPGAKGLGEGGRGAQG